MCVSAMSLPSIGANGLWVNGELAREASWSVDHEKALKHPFPVLVEPDRLKIQPAGKGGRPTKAISKSSKGATVAGGLNLERFALGAKKTAGDADEVAAEPDEAWQPSDVSEASEASEVGGQSARCCRGVTLTG